MDIRMIRNAMMLFVLSFSLPIYASDTDEKENDLDIRPPAISDPMNLEGGLEEIISNGEGTHFTERKFTYIQNKDSISNDWLRSHTRLMRISHDEETLKANQIPAKFDLLTLVPHFAKPFDQGALGSCTGNALAGLVQIDREIEGLGSENISRSYIYWYERFLEGNVNEDSGASLATGLRVLHEYGAPKEELWPYIPSRFTLKPSAIADADAKNNLDLDNLSVGVLYQNLYTLKHTISVLQRPIALGIMIYSSFQSNEVAATGIVPMPDTVNEELLGGHAVLAVGYDDEKKQFKIRNSWGTSWGDGGYFYLPYDYIRDRNLACDFVTAIRIGKKA